MHQEARPPLEIQDRLKRGYESVRDRFEAALRAAQESQFDADSIHAMRIAARRWLAAIEVSQDGRSKVCRLWMHRLEKLRKISNPIRDIDVMWGWMKSKDEPISKKWKRTRSRCLYQLERLLEEKFSTDRLQSQALDVEERTPFETRMLMGHRIYGSLGKFLQRGRMFFADDTQMHRWRVSAKTLRYELEFVRDTFFTTEDGYPVGPQNLPLFHHADQESFEEALTALVEIQQRLGKICDAKQRHRLLKKEQEGVLIEEPRWLERRMLSVTHGTFSILATIHSNDLK